MRHSASDRSAPAERTWRTSRTADHRLHAGRQRRRLRGWCWGWRWRLHRDLQHVALPYPSDLACLRSSRRIGGRPGTRFGHARRDLAQRRDVVHDPERSPHRRRQQITVVNFRSVTGVAGRFCCKTASARLIERHVRAFECPRRAVLLVLDLTNDVHRLIGRDAVGSIGKQLPVLAEVVRHVSTV